MISLLLCFLLQTQSNWAAYGMDHGGQRYSPLFQVSKENVGRLEVAWTYRHGDMATTPGQPKSSFECTPLVVNGFLYFITPFSRVIALDAATGRELWTFDPEIPKAKPLAKEPLIHRGVAYHAGKDGGSILFGTYDGRLFSLDAKTGQPRKGFGSSGHLDLKAGLDRVNPGEFQCAQPPTVIGNVVVVGSTISDNGYAEATDGSIRAFDVYTGKQLWKLDPAPDHSGAGNAWAVISADPETGTLFIPTSSPSPDYFGGLRTGDESLVNALLAVDSQTGEVKWSFQVVAHDVWDYDIPAQPILCDITRKGKTIPSVIILTKMGFVFALDRRTGKSIFPTKMISVDKSKIPGERLATKQIVPILPPPLVPTSVKPESGWGLDESERTLAASRLKELTSSHIFGPPSTQGFGQIPSSLGGCNWSGGAFDPASETLFVNVNNLLNYVRLMTIQDASDFLLENPGASVGVMRGTNWAVIRGLMLSKHGLPINPPPWGELIAVDMSSGSIKWRKPLGMTAKAKGLPGAEAWGSLNLGGAICTSSGLVFIAGGSDCIFRCFDAETGTLLWSDELPAGGNATPITYSVDGSQFIVICAGGHSGLSSKIGDYVVAYKISPQS